MRPEKPGALHFQNPDLNRPSFAGGAGFSAEPRLSGGRVASFAMKAFAMAYTRIPVPRDKIAEARRLYELMLVPVEDVAAFLGVSRSTLVRRIAEWGWKRRKTGALEVTRLKRDRRGRARVVRQTRPRKGAGAVPQSPLERVALAERIQAVVEREIAAVEQILVTLGGTDRSETEGAARTLASLARTLRELVQLDVPTASPEPTNDKPIPRDLAELRRALARKLAALADGDADPFPGEP